MHDGIRLLSKPSKPQICLLICAVVRKDMSEVVKYSCYKIENRFVIYMQEVMRIFIKNSCVIHGAR